MIDEFFENAENFDGFTRPLALRTREPEGIGFWGILGIISVVVIGGVLIYKIGKKYYEDEIKGMVS